MCYHKYKYGSGLMDDGIVCQKCGVDYYPSDSILTLNILLGRVINPPKIDIFMLFDTLAILTFMLLPIIIMVGFIIKYV